MGAVVACRVVKDGLVAALAVEAVDVASLEAQGEAMETAVLVGTKADAPAEAKAEAPAGARARVLSQGTGMWAGVQDGLNDLRSGDFFFENSLKTELLQSK